MVLDGIPPDGRPIMIVSTLSPWVVAFASILTGLLLIFAIICLCFNIIYRNRKLVNLLYTQTAHAFSLLQTCETH